MNIYKHKTIRFITVSITTFIIGFVFAAFLLSLTDIRLRTYKPSWIILDRNHNFIAEVESPENNIGYWHMPNVLPATLTTAVLAAEDRRFRSHMGVDVKSVGRAFINNYIKRTGFSGASTIAMQTARMQRGGGSNLFSKFRDSFAGIWLTLFFGRDKVLKQYVSISPYGNRIAGAACASRRYFKKPIQDLSLAECALLVSVPRAPGRMNLFSSNGVKTARARAHFILERCLKYGWIDKGEYDRSIAELTELTIAPKEIRDDASIHAAIKYKNLLHGSINKNTAAIENIDMSVVKQGLVVSSIDMEIQRYVQNELAAHLNNIKERDVENGAAMVIDKSNGEVLAYIGSGGYFSADFGMIDYAAIKRSTGSLLKPFIFSFGMEELGYTAATILSDVNYDFGEGGRSFVPVNSDREFLGPIPYKYALANSRNVPAVQVLKALGVNNVYKRLFDLKLASDDGRGDYYGLGLSIGGLYCNLTSICRAYLSLANDGIMEELVWFKNNAINSNNGDTVNKEQPKSGLSHKQVLSKPSAMMIQRFLSDPLARLPTFPRDGHFEYPFAVAVKTGTSSGFRDAWCVAWSKRYLVAVWMGNADNRSMKRVSGYDGAAPLVKKIMLYLHPNERDGLLNDGFPAPVGWQPFSICRLTGLLADASTPYVSSDFFAPETEPKTFSNVQGVLPIDTRNGLLANLSCPKKYREYRTFLTLAPEYAAWVRSQGLPVAPRIQSPLCLGERRLIEDYNIEIVRPRSGAKFFIDPEMHMDEAFMPIICVSEPEAESLLWFVNGLEHTITSPPHTLRFKMQSGKYEFQTAIPGTPIRSKPVKIEIF